ncbi:GDP-mannose 4,6-dehydratase [Thiomicrorhabdus sp. ZW0627]|uniref:GDP-mannose 4,6-dehydratase n=1 Tax=Thiomicrorhabdus sp. ZW0627 TaxID=3039774 RepID=UPI0024368F8E|nr:GDP-mannose 4,6-dehydratase [Thiomicrorhabdus sp. ZW0627]MDG6773615.1 GDP-mannose 4,6-dehydratase [Thiomicrorhabdus sp. ZW0627]
MKPDSHFNNKVLVTGLDGFTGRQLELYLIESGYEVVGLGSDLTDRESVFKEVISANPNFVVHLAGISFAAESDHEAIYRVNVIGTMNLLDALCQLQQPLNKVVLASSATVYGNVENEVLSESLCPKPLSHYGCSKLSMEHMAQNYFEKLPVLVARPFNYTGVGHAEQFLVPKIVNAYLARKNVIELGNLDVSREFNDVRDVCKIYMDLLECDFRSDVVNICSGKTISLLQIIELMNQIAGYEISVNINPDFVRDNEIKNLSGDVTKLKDLVQPTFRFQIEDTLRWMYGSAND